MKNKLINILKIVIVVFLLEISIFNINFYRAKFAKIIEINFSHDEIEDKIVFGDYSQEIILENINENVKTIYLDLENTSKRTVEYTVYYSDNTTSFRKLATKKYYSDVEKTKYMVINLSGKTKKIAISVNSNDVIISNIRLNADYPFDFNFVRFIILTAICILIYSIKNDEFWKSEYSDNNSKQNIVILLTIVISVLLLLFFNNNYQNDYKTLDLYNYDFVNALRKGKVSLLDEPSEKLSELNNPYDLIERSQNVQRDTEYIWDAAYYNGKYYIYFGILPALSIMLPYNLITSNYLTSADVTLYISSIVVVVFAFLVIEVFKKYFSKLPFLYMFMSIILIIFGTMLIYINTLPRFYEVVLISGLCCNLLGILFIFTSESKDGKISYPKLFFGSLFLALAVSARPTQLFASMLIIPIIWKYLKQNIGKKKNIFKILIYVGLPYIVIGILLMLYNNIRFGNPLQFGESYQLTVNDMKDLGFRLPTLFTGILCNLFNFPVFKTIFPYIQTNANIISTYCYYYIEDMIGGIFFISPIVFWIFKLKDFNKKCDNIELKRLVHYLLIVGTIFLIFISLKAGSTGRYLCDFSWIFILSGILIFMDSFQRFESKETKKIYTKILTIIVSYTIIINCLTGFCAIGGELNGMENRSPKLYFSIENSIEFWK